MKLQNRLSRLVVATLATLAALSMASCMARDATSDDEAATPTVAPAKAVPADKPLCACDDQPVVDATLLAFLSMARAAHHEADLAVEAGDTGSAISALTRVVKSDWPGKKTPEVIEVTADTLARMADLKSADGKFEEALADVNEGMKMAAEPSHFRGRIFEVRGLVEERRAKTLKEKGDTAGAEKARKAAIESFGQAMYIQEEVIGSALKEKERPGEKQ